jgi:hypothetical protein
MIVKRTLKRIRTAICYLEPVDEVGRLRLKSLGSEKKLEEMFFKNALKQKSITDYSVFFKKVI